MVIFSDKLNAGAHYENHYDQEKEKSTNATIVAVINFWDMDNEYCNINRIIYQQIN